MNTDSYIEALLFWKGEAMSIRELEKALSKKEADVVAALLRLEEALAGRGLVLVRTETAVELRTAPEAGALIEALRKEELSKDLGKAGLETLSIVLYNSPITRAEIDYIRGVNSTFIVRNLLIRGLIEREQNKKDQRSFLYKPTFELLSFLGIRRIEDLPEYHAVEEELKAYTARQETAT